MNKLIQKKQIDKVDWSSVLRSSKTLFEILLDTAQKYPEKIAILSNGNSYQYQELLNDVQLKAILLYKSGLENGDVAILQIRSLKEFLVALFACLRVGVIPLLALPGHKKKELKHLIKTSAARMLITELQLINEPEYKDLYDELQAEFVAEINKPLPVLVIDRLIAPFGSKENLPTFAEVKKEISLNTIALMLVSGGTTGYPKVIPRTHADYYYNVSCAINKTESNINDVYLALLPVAHNFTLASPGLLGMIKIGAKLVSCESADPESTFQLIEKYQVTITSLVPSLANLWIESRKYDLSKLSSLRIIQVGGARFNINTAKTFDTIFKGKLQQVYGMAEGLICFTNPKTLKNLTWMTQGKPMSQYDELKIVDASDNELPCSQEGELLVRGPYTIQAYYNNDKANKLSFSPDGFYRTGDKVKILKSGDVIVTGRIKEMIIRSGENIDCNEIEEILSMHPKIKESVLIGIPDKLLGEKSCVVAVLYPKKSLSYEELRSFFLEQNIAKYKIPDELYIKKGLLKTPVGKVDRKNICLQIIKELKN